MGKLTKERAIDMAREYNMSKNVSHLSKKYKITHDEIYQILGELVGEIAICCGRCGIVLDPSSPSQYPMNSYHKPQSPLCFDCYMTLYKQVPDGFRMSLPRPADDLEQALVINYIERYAQPRRKIGVQIEPEAKTKEKDKKPRPRKQKVNDTQVKEAHKRYTNGETIDSLAHELQVHPVTLWRRFTEAGLPCDRPGQTTGRKPHLTIEQIDLAHQRYSDGEKISQLAHEFGVTTYSMARYFRIHNKPAVDRAVPMSEVCKAYERYLNGEDVATIADSMGIHRTTLWNRFAKAGFAIGLRRKRGPVKRNPPLTPTDTTNAYEQYKTGKPLPEIAKLLNISEAKIKRAFEYYDLSHD